ncbi:MAG: flavin reductase family protein [Corallococcus sp.]|nr:flavin reductase family protein [Corallococcus sp.]MCM1359139.1 flavin reductase family protein [Corallococcus sp.]MCM1394529.1 flavin reductase family protein [Corallococcus sp.]
MSKIQLKGGTLLAPLPAVMVTVGNMQNANIITVAWTGVICSVPPRVYVSVRRDRFSYDILNGNKQFVINLTGADLLPACDWCGILSGRDHDKFAEMKLTKTPASFVEPPLIDESPINLECQVFDVINLGSHDMFLADVLSVHADERVVDENGKIDYALARLVAYEHGEYYATGKHLGRFGFAAQRKFIAKHGKGTDVDMSRATLTHRKPRKKQ